MAGTAGHRPSVRWAAALACNFRAEQGFEGRTRAGRPGRQPGAAQIHFWAADKQHVSVFWRPKSQLGFFLASYASYASHEVALSCRSVLICDTDVRAE